MLEIVERPAVEPVPLPLVKQWCRLYADLTDQDEAVQLVAASERDKLESQTARAFITTVFRETRRIPDDGVLRLYKAPVRSLDALTLDGEEADPASWVRIGESRYQTGSPGKLAVLTYTAGYGDAPEAVPPRAQMLILQFTAWAWDKRTAPDVIPEHVRKAVWTLSWGGEIPPR